MIKQKNDFSNEDFSWIRDGVLIWFGCNTPFIQGIYKGVVDGTPKDIGIDGKPHLVVRLKEMDENWVTSTGCNFAACIPLKCLTKREEI